MKKLLLLSLFVFSFSLEIAVNTTNDYSILTITNDKKFECKQKNSNIYICKFFTFPSTPVFTTNTLDFNITPFFTKKNFYLKIKSKNLSIIKSFKKNLYESYKKRLKKINKTKKWVIISYKKKLPFLSNKKIEGLKFPLKIDTDFYLKAIDINSNPIDYDTQTADVMDYFTILKLFNNNKLKIDRVDEFLTLYPKSIFIPDVLFIKIKLLDEESNSKEIVKLGNYWIKNYSFNEHLPQILLLLAKNYSNEGMMENATYIYERLFTEYNGSPFAYEGMVYLADQLYSAGDNKRAFELYKTALTNSKDKNVVLLSASRIAQRYLDEGDINKSVIYYDKILKASENYLLKDKYKAYELANQLAEHEAYSISIDILKRILKKIDKENNLYEPILYKLAKYSYKLKRYNDVNNYVNNYLDKFAFGDYADEIKNLNDKILFEIDDKNSTIMLQRYDEIIEKYKNTKLEKKAIKKKILLLYKLKKYEELLNINNDIDINKSIILNSAKNVVIKNLNNKNCFKAIKYYKDYNISLSHNFDEKIYYCSFKIREFNIASKVCNYYLLDENKDISLKWFINKAKVFEAKKYFSKLVLIIEDICNLTKNCYQWRYKQFFAYYKLNKKEKFLQLANKLSKTENIKNIDIFMKIIHYAKKKDNTLLLYSYSKKIIKLQKKYNSYPNSPYIDFIFVDSAKKLNKKKEAIKILKNLVKLKIDEDNKARAYYLLSSLTSNKIYLKKCIKLKNSKTWMPLCKDSLELE